MVVGFILGPAEARLENALGAVEQLAILQFPVEFLDLRLEPGLRQDGAERQTQPGEKMNLLGVELHCRTMAEIRDARDSAFLENRYRDRALKAILQELRQISEPPILPRAS